MHRGSVGVEQPDQDTPGEVGDDRASWPQSGCVWGERWGWGVAQLNLSLPGVGPALIPVYSNGPGRAGSSYAEPPPVPCCHTDAMALQTRFALQAGG